MDQDRAVKMIRRFENLPVIPRVDLEVKAVIHQEQLTGKKVELDKTSTSYINHLCVHYLRHVMFTDYKKYSTGKFTGMIYLEVFKLFTLAVEKNYPWLAEAAFSQYYRKRSVMQRSPEGPIDLKLNNLLQFNGYHKPITQWRWFGTPTAFAKSTHAPVSLDLKILKEIQATPREICEQSESEYVRRCKEWLDEKLDDVKRVVNAL